MSYRTLGVIGGMGPAATVDFLARLLAATPAKGDADHMRVLMDCNPQAPGRNAALAGEGPSPGPTLAAMARGLEASGAELLAMPCNAAHFWADEIRAAVAIPLVGMIEVGVAAVRVSGARRVGLLAADAVLRSGLYSKALAAAGIDTVEIEPDAIMPLILRIKAGDTGPGMRAEMAALAAGLVERGADTILAACTEVPLVLDQSQVSVPLVDVTQALVEAVLERARR
ncbi:aspartate/glutamate racemase family protein [Glacieibacterium sp.]|uniref:aspartate/glutamate racemase family protein n=1 Tax=Glacieibacterium sp. TaxID=2860237 RepID=UPI003B00FE0F